MGCNHEKLNVRQLKITKMDGGHVLKVGGVQCVDCKEPFFFTGMQQGGASPHEVRCTRGGDVAQLPLRTVEFNAEKLFCPECGKRVFGRGLDRSPIVAVSCLGVVHRVEFRDGVMFDVSPGRVERVNDEQEAEAQAES